MKLTETEAKKLEYKIIEGMGDINNTLSAEKFGQYARCGQVVAQFVASLIDSTLVEIVEDWKALATIQESAMVEPVTLQEYIAHRIAYPMR